MFRNLLLLGLSAFVFLWNIQGLAQVLTFPEGLLTISQLETTLPHLRQQIRDVTQAVVRVTVENAVGGIEGDATGFIVEDQKGLRLETAFHVVETLFSDSNSCDPTFGTLVISSADRSKTEVVPCNSFIEGTNTKEDYATFRVSGEWKGIDATLPDDLDSGDEVLFLGFPDIFQDGLVSSLGHIGFPTQNSGRLIISTAVALPGMSGGPAFRVGPGDKIGLIGQLRFQTGTREIFTREVTVPWGKTSYARTTHFDLEGVNDLLYIGSQTNVSPKGKLTAAIGVVERDNECTECGEGLNPDLRVQLRAYRNFLETYRSRPTDDIFRTFQTFRDTYRKLVQIDSRHLIKVADFPIGSSGLDLNKILSAEAFQSALELSLKQLDQHEAKLTRIEHLFAPGEQLDEWLDTIAELDLGSNLTNLNDHFLYGLGMIQLWYGR